jgi:uncharacterized membrane protein
MGRLALALAFSVGAILRFHRLDDLSMTGDEAFAWAAASQPISRLLQLQPMLDSGKLAVYDLLLHYWIDVFGDSLRSMRSLSAIIDITSILLMFAVLRELYLAFAEEASTGELAGGFGALLFATNIALVQSGRTTRMYSLMTAAALAEMLFFVRGQRHGRISDFVLTALFLALAIAANFTAAFILISQVLWLVYLMIAERKLPPGLALHRIGLAFSLACGLVLLLPWRRAATSLLRGQMRSRDFGWIPYQPPIHWFYRTLDASVSSQWLFTLLIALAALAIWRHRRQTLLPIFMVAGVVGPLAGVTTASLFGVPMMVDRYVLIAVIAFLGLAAIGAASFESNLMRIVMFGLIICSVKAVNPPTIDWRQAAALASAASPPNTEIGVAPAYALDVVRYHLPPERRSLVIGLGSQCGDPMVLILSPGDISQPFQSALKTCYPRLLARDQLLEIRSR